MPKNTNSKKTAQQYKNDMRALRPFVNFDIDLRAPLNSAQKAKINKYKKELDRMTAGKPYEIQIFRPRDKTKLKKVQEFGGQDASLKEFKVAFIPKTSKYQKIGFNKNGEPYTKTKNVKSNYIALDTDELIGDNIEDYVYSKVKNRTEKRFTIQAGDWEIRNTYSKKVLGKEIAKLALEYSDPTANNFIGKWCHGVLAHEFTDQEDLSSYLDAKRNAKLKKHRQKLSKEKIKTIKLFYWYVPDGDYVIQTKTDKKPDAKAVEITRREYDNFIKTGNLNG